MAQSAVNVGYLFIVKSGQLLDFPRRENIHARKCVVDEVGQLVGTGKILFGSDYPVMSPGRILKEIEAAGLAEEEKNNIICGNAQRLLGV